MPKKNLTKVIALLRASAEKNRRSGRGGKSRIERMADTMSAPTAISRAVKSSVVRAGSGKNVIITNREFITNVTIGAIDNIVSWNLNPGLPGVFRWLSPIAMRFEYYVFKRLGFSFIPSCATATAGSVTIAMDPDPADITPTTMGDLMTYGGATTSAVWCPSYFDVPTRDLIKFGREKYTRGTGTIIGADLQTHDVGKLVLGTTGGSASAPIGNLFVEYEVELIRPQIDSAGELNNVSTLIGSGGAVTATRILGSTPLHKGSTNVGYDYDPTAGTSGFRFLDAGEYLLELTVIGTTIAGLGTAAWFRGPAGTANIVSWCINGAATMLKVTYSFVISTATSYMINLAAASYAVSSTLGLCSDFLFNNTAP